MIQPAYLQPGDCIGILCPAGSIPLEKVEIAVQTIENWGYQVKLGKTVGTQDFSFSASDSDRAKELQEMLDDPQLKAILCARGGYGVSRIIDNIDFTGFYKHPKWVIGFSDITVLHAALQKQNVQSIHGPMAAAFCKGEVGFPFIQSLKNVLEGVPQMMSAEVHPLQKNGMAKGALMGGNLCMMSHLIGSSLQMDTLGKIVFIEDIGEYHYNLDRMMIQCARAGVWENIAGLVVGGFTDLKDTPKDFGKDAYQIIHSYLSRFQYPVCFDFPISHGLANYAVKEGGIYTLEVTDQGATLQG
jgi:muramoyltetrapeptide carboxypeptidase